MKLCYSLPGYRAADFQTALIVKVIKSARYFQQAASAAEVSGYYVPLRIFDI
jgi:hypothetical protein